jgi:hypothetical protein
MPSWLNFTVTRKGRYTTITLGRLRLRLHTVSREWQDLINEADARQTQIAAALTPMRQLDARLIESTSQRLNNGTPLCRAVPTASRDHGKTLGRLGFSR